MLKAAEHALRNWQKPVFTRLLRNYPDKTWYNPDPLLLLRHELQNFIIGSHSSLELGIPSLLFPITSRMLLPYPFLNATMSSEVKKVCSDFGRWNISTGVGHGVVSVGYDNNGPAILMMEPSRLSGLLAPPWVLHHFRPSSEAMLPPCPNPNRWILLGGHFLSFTRCSRSFSSKSKTLDGLGFGNNSPRLSNDWYHWYPSSSKYGILKYLFLKKKQSLIAVVMTLLRQVYKLKTLPFWCSHG